MTKRRRISKGIAMILVVASLLPMLAFTTTAATITDKKENPYPILWYTNGGTPVPTQTSVDNGGTITKPAEMTKSGHTFGGWYDNSGFIGSAVTFPETNVTSAKIYWAKWIPNYTVTWNADGGTPAPTQTDVDEGDTITQQAAMAKTGYTFGGWYDNVGLTGAAVTFPETNVTSTKTYWAKWTLNNYTVTWNADGGTPAPTQTSVDNGGTITQPAEMTKTGYTFGGWYDNSSFNGTAVTFPETNVTSAKTYWAKWTLNKYDLNKDGSIDETDILYLVYFYQWNDRDAGWDTVDLYGIFAKDCDFQVNGKVDLADMIELTANYGIYDPYA